MEENKKNIIFSKFNNISKAFSLCLGISKILLSTLWIIIFSIGVEINTYIFSKLLLNLNDLLKIIHSSNNFFEKLYNFFIFLSFSSEKYKVYHINDIFIFKNYIIELLNKGFYSPFIIYIINIILWGYFWGIFLLSPLIKIISEEYKNNLKFSLKKILLEIKPSLKYLFFLPILIILSLIILIGLEYLNCIILYKIYNFSKILGYLISILVLIILAIINFIFIIIVLNTLFSFTLMCNSIIIDKNDHYDAFSNGIMFLFYKTKEFISYHLLAITYTLLILPFISLFIIGIWKIIEISFGYFIGEFELINFIKYIYILIIMGLTLSYYFSLKVIIYFMLRKDMFGE